MMCFMKIKILNYENLLMFLCFAASGGWQEPENPHTQRVSKASSEDELREKDWRSSILSVDMTCLGICDVYFSVCYRKCFSKTLNHNGCIF